LSGPREKQRMLIQRHQRAEQKKKTEQRIRKVDTSDAMARFETFEHRIDRMEAEADLTNYGRKPTLEDQFAKLQHDQTIEDELSALKARKSGRGSEG